jgi:hypothetical protein
VLRLRREQAEARLLVRGLGDLADDLADDHLHELPPRSARRSRSR